MVSGWSSEAISEGIRKKRTEGRKERGRKKREEEKSKRKKECKVGRE